MTQQTGYCPVHNGELYYEVEGEGGASMGIVFIHACICDHSMWDAQMPAFTQKYRVLRFDQRGHGASRTQDTEYSGRQDLLDLMNHVGIDRAVLIGCSCGGQLALDMALAHPDRVSAVVSVCGGLSGQENIPGLVEAWMKSDEGKYFMSLEELVEAKKFDEVSERETHAWVNGIPQAKGRASAALYQRVLKTVRANYDRQDGKAKATPLDPPAALRLAEVAVPVLFVLGDLDADETHWVADAIVAGVPSARKAVFEDAAHLPSMEQPHRFNKMVLAFLQEI
jgi:3-oxoadipate enol-lactonase